MQCLIFTIFMQLFSNHFTWFHLEWSFKPAGKKINKSQFGPGKEGSLSHFISHTREYTHLGEQWCPARHILQIYGVFSPGFEWLWGIVCKYEWNTAVVMKWSPLLSKPLSAPFLVWLYRRVETFPYSCLLISIASSQTPWWSVSGCLHAAVAYRIT